MEQLLIVEDDSGLSHGIALSLAGEGRRFTVCGTLREARSVLLRESFDLILLDVGLPDGSGLELCREIRQRECVPILFLTANDTELDEVAGLEAGGDDYLTKPFRLAVLRARVAALLRRSAVHRGQLYHTGDLELDFSVAVRRLRGNLEDNPKNPIYVETVYGLGYCWRERL